MSDPLNVVVGRVSSMISNLLSCTLRRYTEFKVSLLMSQVYLLQENDSCVWNVMIES